MYSLGAGKASVLQETHIVGIENRVLDRRHVRGGFKYGTILCGRHPLHQIWNTCTCVLTVGELSSAGQTGAYYPRVERLPFGRLPYMDCLLVFGGIPNQDYDFTTHWLIRLLVESRASLRFVIYIDEGDRIFSEGYRRTVKAMRANGYWVHSRNVCDSEVGAPCRQTYTITYSGLAVKGAEPEFDFWDFTTEKGRPSDNAFRDYLVPRRGYRSVASLPKH